MMIIFNHKCTWECKLVGWFLTLPFLIDICCVTRTKRHIASRPRHTLFRLNVLYLLIPVDGFPLLVLVCGPTRSEIESGPVSIEAFSGLFVFIVLIRCAVPLLFRVRRITIQKRHSIIVALDTSTRLFMFKESQTEHICWWRLSGCGPRRFGSGHC